MAMARSNIASATVTCFVALITAVRSQWIYPPPLNSDWISDYNSRSNQSEQNFPSSNEQIEFIYSDTYGRGFERPDIALDAIDQLSYEERKGETNLYSDFGREDVVVRSGDIIVMDWNENDNKTIILSCQICMHAEDLDKSMIFSACDNYSPQFPSTRLSIQSTIQSSNFSLAENFLALDTDASEASSASHLIPYPLASGTSFIVPPLSSSRQRHTVAVCILTLSSPPALATAHTVPFPVWGLERGDRMIWNAEYPSGRYESDFQRRGGGEGGMGVGTIVGVVIGIVVVLGGSGGWAFWLVMRTRREERVKKRGAVVEVLPRYSVDGGPPGYGEVELERRG